MAVQRRLLTAKWHHLAMLNYEIAPECLAPFLPRGTELDFFQGKTYVSVVGFQFLNTRIFGIPIPWHCNFEEVNLRFYVRRHSHGTTRRGVCFIKELVPRVAIAKIANWIYNENYQAVAMQHQVDRDANTAPHVSYGWKQQQRWQGLTLTAQNALQLPAPDSIEEFIAEHYWGYTPQRDGGTVEYEVQHPPWKIWPATNADLNCDVASLYGAPFVKPLRHLASAFLAEGSSISVSTPSKIC